MQITTADGSIIEVADGTDAATIAALKAAPVCRFSEFVYTGNSSSGQNSGNYEELERLFTSAGLDLVDDDFSVIMHELERGGGLAMLKWHGKTVRYHSQSRRGEEHGQFGYTRRVEYRILDVA